MLRRHADLRLVTKHSLGEGRFADPGKLDSTLDVRELVDGRIAADKWILVEFGGQAERIPRQQPCPPESSATPRTSSPRAARMPRSDSSHRGTRLRPSRL